ncbi:MAG: carbohydrate-binding protein [Bacteroidales bacterium]|nr:carbohydrate-binding protein [Bacteroidales bacterium]
MKNHLKGFSILLSVACLINICIPRSFAQVISPYLIGNNAWMDPSALNNLWDDMKMAKFQSIRIGGNAAEGYGTNYAKYITLIDGVRKSGAEPILQVPRSLTTQQAIDFITYINITQAKNIKLWSIGNEPDHSNNYDAVATVSQYIKRIGSALKSVDSSIITMGPETSWYQNTAYMTPLIGGNQDITGKDSLGHYYIDVVTFHKYMFTDINGLESDVNNLLSKFNIVNANRPEGKKLSWGLTEFNSTYDNSKNTTPDQDVWSFHAGQLFAEVFGLGMRKGAFSMNAWSMLEGQVERAGTDLSLFDKDLKGRASFYHSLLLGQNMKMNYLTTSDNKANVVVIPMADSSGIALMILNKDLVNNYNYSLRLDMSAVVKPSDLQIKVNAGKNIEISGNISKYSTQMLVFDTSGIMTKRYTYTSADADLRGEPLIEMFSDDPVPIVSLSQPSDSLTMALKTTIDLSATANDNGSIVKVEFTANGAAIGTALTEPYNFTWTPPLAGDFIVAARAYDDKGGVGFSEGVRVIVEKVYNYLPIPATIQAEDFDEMLGIQMETTTDEGGGQNVGYCDPGDWLDYTINVPVSGQYVVEARLASLYATGAFNLKSGTNILTSLALNPGTGGWQNWTTLSKIVSLTEGNQTLRLEITGKSININWLRFSFLPVNVVSPQLETLEIFPNPCDGRNFTLNYSGIDRKNIRGFEIYSLSGHRLCFLPAITGEESLSIENNPVYLSPGIYIVSLLTENGVYKEKLMVQ